MPSGFQMIDQYMYIRGQIITEAAQHGLTDQKVPSCNSVDLKEESEIKQPPHVLPQNFLGGLQSGDLYLEELSHPSEVTSVTSSPLSSSSSSPATSTPCIVTRLNSMSQYPMPHYQASPAASSSSSSTSPLSSSPSSVAFAAPNSASRIPVQCSEPFVNRMTMGGCTLSSDSPPSSGAPASGQRSPDHQLAPSPTDNLCDLDKHATLSLYDDSHCGKVAIKTEPGLYQNQPNLASVDYEYRYIFDDSSFGEQILNMDEERFATDIFNLACHLKIHCDPSHWSYQDSQKWVRYQLSRPENGPLHTEESVALFNVAGDLLQRMTEADFQWRASAEGGSFLYRELHKWMAASKYFHDHYSGQKEYDDYEREQDANIFWSDGLSMTTDHMRMAPSSSPAPSMDSTCSAVSSSSGSGQGYAASPYGQMSHESSTDEDVFCNHGRGISRQTLHHPQQQQQQQHQQQHHHPHQTTLPTTTTTITAISSPTAITTGVAHGPRTGRHGGKQTIHLWQFLKELLDEPESYHACIKWTDRVKGIFKIEDSSRVARLWGRRKNRPAMNYDKLSRSVRQYYKKGIIKKTEHSKRLVYQFCPGYL